MNHSFWMALIWFLGGIIWGSTNLPYSAAIMGVYICAGCLYLCCSVYEELDQRKQDKKQVTNEKTNHFH